MDIIQKGLSYYHELLKEIGDKDIPPMHSKDFELRSAYALGQSYKSGKDYLSEKDELFKNRQDILLAELRKIRERALEIQDQFSDKEKDSKQRKQLAVFIFNQIEGIISIHRDA